MDVDKNAYWVAHQPMRSISEADRAKLQRRSTLQTPSVPTFEKKIPASSSSLDPELRDIFEKKLGSKSSAFFKPVAEAVPDMQELSGDVSPEPEIPSLQEESASEPPAPEHDIEKTELQSDEMKKISTLLTRTLLFAERRRKEGREVFRRRTQFSACFPDPLNETDIAVNLECHSATPSIRGDAELEKETPVEIGDADTVASFPKVTDTTFSSVDLTDRASENPWSRPNELLAQLRQISNVVVHMISTEDPREEEKDEAIPSEENKPIYSDPLQESDKAKLKWYERPFKANPFEYIPKPSPRFNCLCPGIVDF